VQVVLVSISMRTIRTPGKRRRVLEALAKGWTADEAARKAGMSRRALFQWRADDSEFRCDYEAAYASGTDCLEAIARRRAVAESDTLLIFLLKTRDPDRFNRKQVQVAIGGDPEAPPIDVEHHVASGQVTIQLPYNYRDKLDPGVVVQFAPPPEIEGEAEPAQACGGVSPEIVLPEKEPEQSEQWQTIRVKRS
jgi:hypothetical protein